MSLSIDAAQEAKDEAQQGNLRENDAGIPEEIAYDYEQHDAPLVRGHPNCLVAFDRIVGLNVFNTSDDFLEHRQNLEGAGPNGYGNNVIITVENPSIVNGQLWEAGEDNFEEFRVIGDPESDESPYSTNEEVVRDDDGNVVGAEVEGVDLGMGEFEGTPAEDQSFDTDYVQFLISARRATDILGALDTAGNGAFDQDGNLVEGIIEYHPQMGTGNYDSDSHGAPRAIGYPELRSDMVDQPGAIMWSFDVDSDSEATTQSPVEVTLFKLEDGADGLAIEHALTGLRPGDDAYALPTYPRGGNLFWHDRDGGEEDIDVDADAEPSGDGSVSDAQDLISGDDGRTSYEDLTDGGKEFVDDAVEMMEGNFDSVAGLADTDKDFEERVADVRGEQNIEADTETLGDIIDDRLGGN